MLSAWAALRGCPLNRDDKIALLIFGALSILIVLMAAASAEDKPTITCEEVKAKVAEVGKVKALAFALANGAKWSQIKEARKCLKPGATQ